VKLTCVAKLICPLGFPPDSNELQRISFRRANELFLTPAATSCDSIIRRICGTRQKNDTATDCETTAALAASLCGFVHRALQMARPTLRITSSNYNSASVWRTPAYVFVDWKRRFVATARSRKNPAAQSNRVAIDGNGRLIAAPANDLPIRRTAKQLRQTTSWQPGIAPTARVRWLR
jgi:hypothetical protein